MKKRQTQQWLQEIYRRPYLYEGKIVAILDDTQIVAVADSFTEARRKAETHVASTSSNDTEEITLFSVPRHVTEIQIPTLRMRSLREDLWQPVYPVTLQADHGEIEKSQMLIDSGADFSLIRCQAGKELGLSRSDEEVLLFAQGIGGRASYLLRRIRLVIDGHPVSAMVAWCQDEDIEEMIVGRQDVFDAFHIEFRQSERRVIFKPVEDKES